MVCVCVCVCVRKKEREWVIHERETNVVRVKNIEWEGDPCVVKPIISFHAHVSSTISRPLRA